MEKTLEHVTVLDLTRVLAGPFCCMMLADMGANVIKIESVGKGDDSRGMPPIVNGESCYYMNLNRNKKGVTLNLKAPEGKAAFLKMVEKADIVVENFRPGVMDRLGLGYEDLKKVNPKIVYGCVSGFGHYGPYKDRGGYDIVGQAMSGMMSTTGWPDSGPTRTGTAIADVLAGLSVCIGVLAAGRIPERIGNRYESCYPYDSFPCKDGELVIGCANDSLFVKLTNLMGKPELLTDPRFEKNVKRVENHAALRPIVAEWTSQYNRDELVQMILDVGVPAAPINTIADTTKDPHIAGAREMFVEVDHPVAGKMKLTGCHIKMSRTPSEIRTHAPLLGQDNDEIYGSLGYSADEIAHMKEAGVI